MRNLTLLAILLLITAAISIQAQNSPPSFIKNAQGQICAEGDFSSKIRKGNWKFYLSDASRKSRVADMTGSYNDKGIKQGEWIYTNTQTQISIKVHFENGMMQGECVYFDADKTILARGLMQDGIRHGKWIFYDQGNPTGGYHTDGLKYNKKMTEGYYKDGVRIGQWDYDYFLDKNTHVKGALVFENGTNNGRLDFYKVTSHPTFGSSEELAGSGSYTSGKKTGRWIEFNYGVKGDFIETGNYDSDGNRDGLWKVRIGDQTHLAGSYNHGVPHGKFYHYYENGQVKYETNYNNGLEEGDFKSYYATGQIQEQGTHVIIADEITKDTQYLNIKLPYEFNFELVEEDFVNLNPAYISWLHEPGYSIAPAELSRRFNLYLVYGKEAQQRIEKVVIQDKKSVREGPYMAFYEDGGLKLKGNHSPHTASIFDPNNHSVAVGFARDGEWKEYGSDKLLKSTYIYEEGKLKKMLDGNGYIVHTFQYEANGMVSIDGKAVPINK